MDNKKKIIILMVLGIIFSIIGGTFAYWSWQTIESENTNIVFTIESGFSCEADGGGNITDKDALIVPTNEIFEQVNQSMAEGKDLLKESKNFILRKVKVKPTINETEKTISMDLWLDINELGEGLSNSKNFEYVFFPENFYELSNEELQSKIIEDNFYNKKVGDRIELLSKEKFSETKEDTYYLVVFLSGSETDSSTMNQKFDFSLNGVCTEVMPSSIYAIYSEDDKSLRFYNQLNMTNKVKKGDIYNNLTVTDIWEVEDDYNYNSSVAASYDFSLEQSATPLINKSNGDISKTDIENGGIVKKIVGLEEGFSLKPWSEKYSDEILKVIIEDKISPIDTANWFYGLYNCEEMNLVKLDTSNVTNMKSMFVGCSSLTTLDLSSFDTSRVTYMGYMFDGCSGLTNLNLSSFDTSNVTNMESMFYGCSSLTTLDLSSFDTSRVEDMHYMFEGCSSLTTLDLSSFDTSRVTYMDYMFDGCSSLTNIYVSTLWNTSSVTNSNYMFDRCAKLPNYNSSVVDKTNAHYNTGGYLTLKN